MGCIVGGPGGPRAEANYAGASGADAMAAVVLGVALAALASYAAYLCLSKGFTWYDKAHTLWEKFLGGSGIYMGLGLSFVAAANALCALRRIAFNPGPYTCQDAKEQVVYSLAAPILFAPVALCYGAQLALQTRR